MKLIITWKWIKILVRFCQNMESYIVRKVNLRQHYESCTINTNTVSDGLKYSRCKTYVLFCARKNSTDFFCGLNEIFLKPIHPTWLSFTLILCLGSFLEITEWSLSHWKCTCSNDKWMIWLCVSWISDNSALKSVWSSLGKMLAYNFRICKPGAPCVPLIVWINTDGWTHGFDSFCQLMT